MQVSVAESQRDEAMAQLKEYKAEVITRNRYEEDEYGRAIPRPSLLWEDPATGYNYKNGGLLKWYRTDYMDPPKRRKRTTRVNENSPR